MYYATKHIKYFFYLEIFNNTDANFSVSALCLCYSCQKFTGSSHVISHQSSQLDSKLQDDKYDSIDGGIGMKVEALEPGLFEQSVQLRRWHTVAGQTKGLKHHCIVLFR